VTHPSTHSRRARDHATPVCWRTTAATVGSVEFSSMDEVTAIGIRRAARGTA
jgi:hypothetical protein